MKHLYIIGGCNGAGKTTASYSILPRILDCHEFVNADEIAKGLSPFNVEEVAFEAGRIMLTRIDELMAGGGNFAFETTLASRSFLSTIEEAQNHGYFATLIFFWLDTVESARQRVSYRVTEGGHFIPDDVIERRYHRALQNFFNLYIDKVDAWMLINNVQHPFSLIALKDENEQLIFDQQLWKKLENEYKQ